MEVEPNPPIIKEASPPLKFRNSLQDPYHPQASTTYRARLYFVNAVKDIASELSCSNFFKMWNEFHKSCVVLTLNKSSWSSGLVVLVLGLFMSYIDEIIRHSPQYNTSLLLALMASIAFSSFPKNSVRPQLILTLLTVLSLAIDLKKISQPTRLISTASKVLTSFVIIAKIYALYDVLTYSPGSARVRKYLDR